MLNSNYKLITERNKLSLNKPQDTDIIYYSELNEWFTSNAFRSFSIKCVIDQTIIYKVGAVEHEVRANNFLLSLKQPFVKAYFSSNKTTKSICIDICPSTVDEVFTILTDQNDPDFENYLSNHYRPPEFLEYTSHLDQSFAGRKLKNLVETIRQNKDEVSVNKEWFFEMMEIIIHQEFRTYQALNSIKSLKTSTRKEVYKRVKTGRDYMDDNFLKIESIKQVAMACSMSEYHFFRSFKQVYETSPYQYLLRKRLSLASELFAQQELSLTNIAAYCSFPDLFTFSKAFKKQFKMAPSVYREKFGTKIVSRES